ncbi:MAG: preprotein translocase subunit SecG [Saprospiraceae bacterium]|nr:preprotein translocase subunit SecG [Saprospiraceae bacterium]
MLSFLTVMIVLVSVLLMAVVLIQNPKGGGVDPTFGGQAQQLFGAARSTDFVETATWVLAGLLFALCVFAALTVGVTVGAEGADIPLQTQGQ